MRSYIDPTLFIVYYYFDVRDYGPEVLSQVKSYTQRKGVDIQPLLNVLKRRNLKTFSHEQYHFWQGLRLPFLYRYAFLTLMDAMRAAREFSRRSEDWTSWDRLGAISPAFYRLNLPHYMGYHEPPALSFGMEHCRSAQNSIRYSAMSMLECATSLFQYQISTRNTPSLVNPLSLQRWRKRNASHLHIFDFVANALTSKELAMAFLLPLINAAFHTTKPEVALFELLARLRNRLSHRAIQESPSYSEKGYLHIKSIVDSLTESLDYDVSYGSHPETIDIYDNRYFFLEPNDWLGGGLARDESKMLHPILGVPALDWQRRARADSAFRDLLSYPGLVASEDAIKYAVSREPSVRVVRLRLTDGQNKVLVLGEGMNPEAFKDHVFNQASSSVLSDFLLDVIAAYGSVRRAYGLDEADSPRLCFHTECKFFDKRYCTHFPMVPDDYARCSFPDRMNWFASTMGEE